MASPLPTRTLPAHPDLDQLKRQAKELLDGCRSGQPPVVLEVRRFYHDADPASFALHDAQLVLARSYGYDSWPKLKAYVDGITVHRLVSAVRQGDLDEARGILGRRPELVTMVEAWNNEHTALHHAVLQRLPEMVRLLMAHGADAHAGISPHTDATGALTMAADRGYDEIVAIIRDEEAKRHGARPVVQDMPEEHRRRGADLTLRSAVLLGDEEFLRARLREGPVAPEDDRGWLLRLAVDSDRPDMLKLLLELGLDPDARARVEGLDEVTFTWGMPLYQCVRHGQHAMAQCLLARGADPNAQVYASGTPLSEAYGQRDERMITLLERHGGRSNPTMAGFYRRKDLALRLLAEQGDAVLPSDGFGSGTVAEQLVGSAARGGDPDILAIALARVAWPRGDMRWYGALTKPLEFWNHWVGPWCHPEWDRTTYLTCFKMLLERCGPPTARLRFGTTLLHEIVTMGDHVAPGEREAFATAALDAGAPMDVRDDLLRSTPLGWACRWAREDLVQLFLERGADAAESDAEPWARPLAWATRKRQRAIENHLRRSGSR